MIELAAFARARSQRLFGPERRHSILGVPCRGPHLHGGVPRLSSLALPLRAQKEIAHHLEEELAVVPDVAAVEVQDRRTLPAQVVLPRAHRRRHDDARLGRTSSLRLQPAAVVPEQPRRGHDGDERDQLPTRLTLSRRVGRIKAPV